MKFAMLFILISVCHNLHADTSCTTGTIATDYAYDLAEQIGLTQLPQKIVEHTRVFVAIFLPASYVAHLPSGYAVAAAGFVFADIAYKLYESDFSPSTWAQLVAQDYLFPSLVFLISSRIFGPFQDHLQMLQHNINRLKVLEKINAEVSQKANFCPQCNEYLDKIYKNAHSHKI